MPSMASMSPTYLRILQPKIKIRLALFFPQHLTPPMARHWRQIILRSHLHPIIPYSAAVLSSLPFGLQVIGQTFMICRLNSSSHNKILVGSLQSPVTSSPLWSHVRKGLVVSTVVTSWSLKYCGHIFQNEWRHLSESKDFHGILKYMEYHFSRLLLNDFFRFSFFYFSSPTNFFNKGYSSIP